MDIQAEQVEYVYNPGTPLERRALDRVDFGLESGRVLGILGGTGSGKTTLIRNLNGLLFPTRGRILIGGRDTRDYGPELRMRVGVVFQQPERQLFEETVFDDIAFVPRRFSNATEDQIRSRVDGVCRRIGLDIERVGPRSPLALSQGEKRKAAIAGVLMNDPEVLAFDEPAVGLDPPGVAEFAHLVNRLSTEEPRKTVCIVSHDMGPFLPLLDRLLALDRGRSAAFGTPNEVCRTLANDPKTRDLLPDIAILAHELEAAGHYAADAPVYTPEAVSRRIEEIWAAEGGSS